VKSGTLLVKLDRSTSIHYSKGSKIHVHTAKLNNFTLGGTASVTLNNTLKDSLFLIKSSSAASFTGKLKVSNGEIELVGTATAASIDLSRTSNLTGYDFDFSDHLASKSNR